MIRSIRDEYFDWMYILAMGPGRRTKDYYRYTALFAYLDHREFIYTMDMDANRAEDGIELRYKFAREVGLYDGQIRASFGDEPCSIFEMMVALADRCETQIMSNDIYGDRTWYWFRYMLRSLGLNRETNDTFSVGRAEIIIDQFLDHKYDRDGRGSLFYVPGTKKDMRKLDIWYQMHAFLETVDE